MAAPIIALPAPVVEAAGLATASEASGSDPALRSRHRARRSHEQGERVGQPFTDRQPIHPGTVLREDVLPAPHVSVTAIAERLGVSRQMLHGLLSERHAVTTEMAARIGRLLGNGSVIWLRMQQAHDLWRFEHDQADELARIPTLTAHNQPGVWLS